MDSERLFRDDVLTSEVAHQMLSPDYSNILTCIRKAVTSTEELRQREPDFCSALTSRSWANIVHDHMEMEANIIFNSSFRSDVFVYKKTDFLIVDFYEKIFLRFKKLDKNLSPCNIKTNQQRAFDDHTLFRGSATLVTAGYRLNELGLYKDSHIVCWDNETLLWSIRIPDEEQGKLSKVTVPVEPIQPTIVIKRKVVAKEAM